MGNCASSKDEPASSHTLKAPAQANLGSVAFGRDQQQNYCVATSSEATRRKLGNGVEDDSASATSRLLRGQPVWQDRPAAKLGSCHKQDYPSFGGSRPSVHAQLVQPTEVEPCQELDVLVNALCHIFDARNVSVTLFYKGSYWLANVRGERVFPKEAMSNLPVTVVCEDVLQEVQSEAHRLLWEQHGLRSYCSAPLLASSGQRLGSVCFMDTVPRRIDAGMCRVLNNFGELAVRTLERRVSLMAYYSTMNIPMPIAQHSLTEAAQARDPLAGSRQPPQKRPSLLERAAQAAHVAAATGPAVPRGSGSDVYTAADTTLDSDVPDDPQLQRPSLLEYQQEFQRAQEQQFQRASVSSCPADVLLVNSSARRTYQPSTAHTDTCCLIVDAGAPGWPVLYADETWKLWTGFSRTSLLERGLQGLLAPASPGVCPMNWDMLQRQADAGERFIIPGVAVVPLIHSPSRKTCGQPNFNKPAEVPGACANASAGAADQSMLALNTAWFETVGRLQLAAAALQFEAEDEIGTVNPAKRGHALVGSRASRLPKVSVDCAGGVTIADDDHLLDSPRDGQGFGHGSRDTTGSKGSLPQVGRALDLTCRPMALDVLDEDTLPTGIPSTVPMQACASVKKLYVVWLHTVASSAGTGTEFPGKVSHMPNTVKLLTGRLLLVNSDAQVLGCSQ